jgi:hypothetical protein
MNKWYHIVCLLSITLAACSPAQEFITPKSPLITQSAPNATAVHTVTSRLPTMTPDSSIPTPDATKCPWELVLPQFTQIEPSQVTPGQEMKLIGKGGSSHNHCGAIHESARDFAVYLDDLAIGTVTCYVNRCEGIFTLPADLQPGMHCLSAEPRTCGLEIQVLSR